MRDAGPHLPEDEVSFGSRGWKECWLWKGGPSRRLRSVEGPQRTGGGPPSDSSPASPLCCSAGFRATATGGRGHSLRSPFSGS